MPSKKRRRNPRAVATIDERGRFESVELTRTDIRQRLGYWPDAAPPGGLLRLHFLPNGKLQAAYSLDGKKQETNWHTQLDADELAELVVAARQWAEDHR